MRTFIVVSLCFLLVTGCAKKPEQVWFETQAEAIQYGFQQEGITIHDMIAREERDGVTLIIYKIDLPEGMGMGAASLVEENGKYAWYRGDQPWLVQYAGTEKSPVVKTVIRTITNKQFIIYSGSTKDPHKTIDTENGPVTPYIDTNTGLFYYVE